MGSSSDTLNEIKEVNLSYLLLAQRLREVLPGGAATDARSLHMALDSFEQVFDSAERSRVVVRVRATLMLPGSGGVRSRTFARELPVSEANAAQGVRSLSQASDALLGELLAWAVAP